MHCTNELVQQPGVRLKQSVKGKMVMGVITIEEHQMQVIMPTTNSAPGVLNTIMNGGGKWGKQEAVPRSVLERGPTARCTCM